MATNYYVTPTNYGLSLIAQAHNTNSIQLNELVLGDANGIPYLPINNKHKTILINQCAKVPIQTVTLINESIIRVVATVPSHIGGFHIHEIGLTDQTNQLVYIGNYHGGYKPELLEGAGGDLTLCIDIKPEQGANIIIQAANPVFATQTWVSENFVSITEFSQHQDQNTLEHNNLLNLLINSNNNIHNLKQELWRVNSVLITPDPNYNPAVELEPILGVTKWRKLPFLLNGVSNASNVGKLTYLKNGADVAAVNVNIWQRMPNNYVTPIAQIYYAAQGMPDLIDADHFFAFDYVNLRSFYIIKMNVAVDLPIQYKMTSSGQIVDNIIKESQGILFVDDNGFGLIPTRVKMNADVPLSFDHKIELSLSEQYQHVCVGGSQKYRFLDTKYDLDTNVQYSISLSKKYVSANEQFEIIVTRLATNGEDKFLILNHIYLSDENLRIGLNDLRAVDYFDLMPESSVGVTLHESYDGNTITDHIFKLSFLKNELEKKIVLRVKNLQFLNRMNILALLDDSNNLSFLSLDYSNNFVLEKNIPQPTYFLSYNILGLTLTISLETTLVPVNTHVAWNITNYVGDPISPNDMAGEFIVDEDGYAEVKFTIQAGDAFSFSFNLTGREEYVGVKRD